MMTMGPIKLEWTTECGNPDCRKCSRETAIEAAGICIGVDIKPNAPGETCNVHMVGITVFPVEGPDYIGTASVLVDPLHDQSRISEMIWLALDKYGDGPVHIKSAPPACIPRIIELREGIGGEHRHDDDLRVDRDLLPGNAGCHSQIVGIRMRPRFVGERMLKLIVGGVT